MNLSKEEQVRILGNSAETGYNSCGCATPHKTVTEFVDCVLRNTTASPTEVVPYPKNLQLVHLQGETVLIEAIRTRMSKREALAHAAWIVSVVEDEDTFMDILEAIHGYSPRPRHA